MFFTIYMHALIDGYIYKNKSYNHIFHDTFPYMMPILPCEDLYKKHDEFLGHTEF